MLKFIFLNWLLLLYPGACIVIAFIGRGRKIGFWPSFLLSLFLTPLIGAIFTATSPTLVREQG